MPYSFGHFIGSAFVVFLFISLSAAQQAQELSQTGVATIRTSTQLVVVDVVVTDRNHKPVRDLKSSDFTLTEDNSRQVIRNFEEHAAPTLADTTKLTPAPELPRGMFTNYVPEPVNGALTILLLDTLNTPVKDQNSVRQQLLTYLNAAQQGTRIAIFGLSTKLTVLQSFTSNSTLLRAVASGASAKNSPMLRDSMGSGAVQKTVADQMEEMGADPSTLLTLRQFESQQQSFQLKVRVKYTLDAMNQLGRYLAGIPGRKNLIWFSGSFPVDVLPDRIAAPLDPFDTVANYEKELRETVDVLARSQVAVYPIDARGITTSPSFDVETTRNYTRNPGRLAQDISKADSDNAAEHDTMRRMAEATGGHAFYNTNNLAEAVATAIALGSNFYSLSYTPTNANRDGKFRRIKVQLTHGSLELSYRRGYFANPWDGGPAGANAADASLGNQNLRSAMTRGSPEATQIIMKAAVYPATASPQTEEVPAPENVLAANIHGPFRRYSVDYIISPTDITFLPAADDKVHSAFELGVFVFNSESVLINRLSTQVRTVLTLDELRDNTSQGLKNHQEFSVPAQGEYFVRLVAHDLTNNHLGAIEVSTRDIKDLSPVKTLAAVSTPGQPKSPNPANSLAPSSSPDEALPTDEAKSIEPPTIPDQPKTMELSKRPAPAKPHDGTILTLHVYTDLIQVPTLVRDHNWQQINTPISENRFSVSLNSGPWYRATHVRQEGTDPISLAILLHPAGNSAELVTNIRDAVAALSPLSLREKDHLSIYALDCTLVNSWYDIPFQGPGLQAAIDTALQSWKTRLKKHKQDCQAPTFLLDSLASIIRDLPSLAGRRVIFAVTDGVDGGSKHTWNEVRLFASQRGVAVFGLTYVPQNSEKTFLSRWNSNDAFHSLCESSGGMVFPTSGRTLGQTLQQIISAVRDRYIVEFPTPSNSTAGSYGMRIRIEKGDYIIKPSGISVPLPDPALAANPTTVPTDSSLKPELGRRKTTVKPD